MDKRIVAMGMWSLMVWGLVGGSAAWAKPADLPVPGQMQCPDGQENVPHGEITLGLDLWTGRITVKIEAMPAVETGPIAIDAFMPIVLEHLFKQVADALTQQAPAPDRRDANTRTREQQTRRLFEAAERLRRSGNYEKARITYQQLHLLAPTTPLGRLAIERLQEVEERMRDSSEESGSDDAEESFREMQQNSVPLGLVHASY